MKKFKFKFNFRLIEKYNCKKEQGLGPMITVKLENKLVRSDEDDNTNLKMIPEKNGNWKIFT